MPDSFLISRVITPAKSKALISLNQAKDICGIAADDDSQDGTVGLLVAQLSAAIDHYCDRTFVVQTYRDQLRYPSCSWGEPLRTRQFPIATDDTSEALLTITIDGVVLDPSEYDIDLDNGRVYRVASGWAGQSVVLDYTAGFDPVPSDVQAAVSSWLVGSWAARGRDPLVRSEAVFDVITVTYADPSASNVDGGIGPPDTVAGLLVPYRVWFV